MGVIEAIRRESAYMSGIMGVLKWVKPLTPEWDFTLGDEIEAAADKFGGNTLFVFEGTSWTYAQFDGLANRYANWALAQGLKAGDSVALLMQNRPEYVAVWAGLSKVGVATAMINTNLQGIGLAHCVNISNARHLILGAELSETLATVSSFERPLTTWATGAIVQGAKDLDEALSKESPDRPSRRHREALTGKDTAMYIYTSGTTGLPKAAKVSFQRAQGYMRSFVGAVKTTAADRIYITLPLYHATGGMCAVGAAMLVGGTIILRRKFSASHFWDDISDQRATMFVYIGELCRYLINQPPHPKEAAHGLRACFGNGMRPDVWERFQPRFKIPRVLEFYGSTEGNVSFMNFDGTMGAIGRIPKYMEKTFTARLVRFDVEAETPVRGPDGLCIRCAPGEVGEAIGKIDAADPRSRFDGYSGDRAQTEKKLLRDVFEKGDVWFRTGDLMKQDDKGYFYFIDRIGDTFRWKGENVSTNEVGEVLSAFDGLEEAIVYGVPVGEGEGKAGMAAITPRGALDLVGLKAHLERNLPAYARPMFLRVRAAAEITGTFKYTKVDLVREGFDPGAVTDPLYFFSPESGGYVPLTPAEHTRILNRQIKF
jgi:fatty-acyl-CoA synthase